jgi:hypothetical protein
MGTTLSLLTGEVSMRESGSDVNPRASEFKKLQPFNIDREKLQPFNIQHPENIQRPTFNERHSTCLMLDA